MLKVKILYSDGQETEVSVGPRARVEVERCFEVKFWDLWGPGGTANEDNVYFMAFSAARFAGLTEVENYDDWLLTIDDVDIWSTEDKANPTRRAAKPAKSSSSASSPESPSGS